MFMIFKNSSIVNTLSLLLAIREAKNVVHKKRLLSNTCIKSTISIKFMLKRGIKLLSQFKSLRGQHRLLKEF